MKTIVTNKSLSLEKMIKLFGMVLMLFLSISNAHAQLLSAMPLGQILISGKIDVQGGGVNAEDLSTGSAFVGTFPPTPASACFGNRALNHTTNINYALIQTDFGQTLLNAAPTQAILFKIGNDTKMKVAEDGDCYVYNNLVVGDQGNRKPGCVLMVDGRTYISEQNNANHLDKNGNEVVAGSEKGFTDLASENFKDYLLWVEEGIVSADFAIAETTDWPDYVFKADYNLSSLSELEKSIKEKGHLPNMPAATEVEKNGFTVNDMTKRMVKTIEELTLYTIDQEKELAKQKELVNTLLQRLEKLEAAAAKK